MPSSDLTLAEVAEGKQYGLNAETTYTLKNLYGQRAVQAQKEKHQETWFEERQKVVREVRAELEPKMLEAAKMEVRSQLEAVFPDEMRVRIRKEIEAEIAATVPTNRQREAAKRACGEIEIEALTEARAASSLAEATVKERDDSAPLYRIVFRFFMFAFLPVLALAHHHGWTAEDVKLWAVGIPWLVATCVAGVASGDFETKMKKKITGYRTLVKEHRNVARKARETRLVHIDVANTRGDITEMLQRLANEQSGPSGFNERDVDLIPPDVVLDAERVRVRDALAESMDPDMFLSQVPEEEEPHKKEAAS